MAKTKLTIEQKKLDTDIWVIVITSLAILGGYLLCQNQFRAFVQDDSINILWRVILAALVQFGIAGLGISIVSIIRKESFLSHGLRKEGAFHSIILCSLCFVPYIIFVVATGNMTGYLPFQSVWTTKEVLASGFPINVLGMLITATAWGFFEGFNYVVISDKINKRYPSKNRWVNWGAISCAVLCVLIHGVIGITPEEIIEMITTMIIIYGMLMVKEFTGNAWGCVFIFIFFWNAF